MAMAGKDGEVAVGIGCRQPVSGLGESGKTVSGEEMRWQESKWPLACSAWRLWKVSV